MALDLASLASVQAFATAFLSSEPRLDILIHNAGEKQQALQVGGLAWRGKPDLTRGQQTRLADGDSLRPMGHLKRQLMPGFCPRDQFLWPDSGGL